MEGNLKNKAIFSAFWKFTERILAQVITLIVSIIIARILMPSDYAVVSIVTIFFSFANIIISGGLNTALIQKKDTDALDYSSVLWVSLSISAAVYAALFFSAPAISRLYEQPMLIPVIRVMGLILPVCVVKSIWCAYISANLQFKKFFFATLGGTLLSGIIGVAMAIKGFGAWALVAQQMSNTLIDTVILIFTTRIRIVLKVSLSKIKVLFGYGWKLLVSSLIGTVYSKISPLVIGIKFTPNDLSFYTKGESLPSVISATSIHTLSAVLFPVIAKCQDDKERVLYCTRQFMRIGSFLLFPLMLGFFAVSDHVITILLTEKWLPASYYVRIFCLTTMFDVVCIGNCETIKAIGRSDIYLKIEIVKKTCYFIVLAGFILFSNTPEIMALSYIVCAVIQITVNSIPNRRLINYQYRQQIADLLPSLLCSAAMCIIVSLVGLLSMNIYALTALQIVIGIAVYSLLAYIFNRNTFTYILGTAKDLIKRRQLY